MTTRIGCWFAAIGAPFDATAAAAGSRLVTRLPAFVTPAIERVHRTADVVRALRAIEAEGSWWDLQEAEREAVWTLAAERLGEDALVGRIAASNEADAALVRAIALPDALAADPTLAEAAREAALLVLHQAALAAASEAHEHWFLAHHALYDAGHWPLGMAGGRLFVF
jgi:hypothetical protein